MEIVAATRSYERWMASRVTVVRADLLRKHQRMAENPFILLRATFYRWMQMWPNICASLTDAPIVPSIGDLHLENFGTWRDAEGRLVWGVNDIDETCALPYTNDLVRLATSAVLATRLGHFTVTNRAICDAILDGYATSMNRGGRPLVLAEQRRWLREIAVGKLRDPVVYWPKLETLPRDCGPIPDAVFRAALPAPRLPYRALRRTAGVGSLGRRRIVALAEWRGALIAREAKAWLPSAAVWATGRNAIALDADTVLRRAVRAPDPFLQFHAQWIVRRLAPDCSRIELQDLPETRDEQRLLRAMGWETANLHLGRPSRRVRVDLGRRPRKWLVNAATAMANAVEADWTVWVKYLARR